MAFVLGLETDSINGWMRFDGLPGGRHAGQPDRDPRHDPRYFAYLRGLGIVQVNLIHLSDNAFGGMAIYDFMFTRQHAPAERAPAEDAAMGRRQRRRAGGAGRSPCGSELWALAREHRARPGDHDPAAAAPGAFGIGDVNRSGLTVAGEVALLEAMRLGMVIDTDHMSELSEATAFDIATTTVGGRRVPAGARPQRRPRLLAPRPLAVDVRAGPGLPPRERAPGRPRQ